jgi:hypothetical protein
LLLFAASCSASDGTDAGEGADDPEGVNDDDQVHSVGTCNFVTDVRISIDRTSAAQPVVAVPAAATPLKDVTYGRTSLSTTTLPNYAEALRWTRVLLGDSSALPKGKVLDTLMPLANCIRLGEVAVSVCGFAEAVAGGPKVAWYKYTGQCQGIKAGQHLKRAAEAFEVGATAGTLPMGPLVSWTTVAPECASRTSPVASVPAPATAACNSTFLSTNDGVDGYLDPMPALTRNALGGSATSTAAGTRGGLAVTIYKWTAAFKACAARMNAGDPCSIPAFPALSPTQPERQITSTISKSGTQCKCIQ